MSLNKKGPVYVPEVNEVVLYRGREAVVTTLSLEGTKQYPDGWAQIKVDGNPTPFRASLARIEALPDSF